MRRLHPAISIVALLTLAFLYLPLIVVAIYSFNDAPRGFVWRGFTLKWYAQVFQDAATLKATLMSLVLAGVSTLIATVLGTMLAIGIDRFPWSTRTRSAMDLTLHLPVVTPDIIFAVALVIAFQMLATVSSWFEPGLTTMILGHVTFQAPFVALVVRGRLSMIDRVVEEAGRDLYAGTPRVMGRVTIPLLMPGIVAGALLAFTLSLDDFVISFFTASPYSTTLPIYIYGELRRGVTASTTALSTLIFVVTVLLVFSVERLTRSKTK